MNITLCQLWCYLVIKKEGLQPLFKIPILTLVFY